MIELTKICEFLDRFAPTRLAEDWDNVGLLVGDERAEIARIMTCLTITPETVQEAIESQVNLIVAHHPLPFRPIKKLTTGQTATRMLLQLIQAGIAVYSPHTGFDSAQGGINQMVCDKLGLVNVQPLIPIAGEPTHLGAGRFGDMDKSISLAEFIALVKPQLCIDQIQFVGEIDDRVSRVASACGSGGSFIEHVADNQCSTFVTGEASFHTCLEARAKGISLVMLGHYCSERFAIEQLASILQDQFTDLDVWAAKKESDPVCWA